MQKIDYDIENTLEIPPLKPDGKYQKKKDPKRIVFPRGAIFGICLAILISAGLVIRTAWYELYGHHISLLTDAEIIFSGYNGNGVISSFTAPEEAALQAMQNSMKNGEISDKEAMNTLMNSISCSFNQTDHLSNGMTVTYACRYNARAASQAGYSIIDTSLTYTVMGLKDLTEIDPFEGITVSWEGDTLIITPEESLQNLGLTYTWEETDDQNVLIKVQADLKVLSTSGYILKDNMTEKEIYAGPKPGSEISFASLTQSEKDILNQNILAMVDNELSLCGHEVSFGKDILTVSVREVCDITADASGTYTVSVLLDNIFTQGVTAKYYTFTATYTGYIRRNGDGNIIFETETRHACAFDGMNNVYELLYSD